MTAKYLGDLNRPVLLASEPGLIEFRDLQAAIGALREYGYEPTEVRMSARRWIAILRYYGYDVWLAAGIKSAKLTIDNDIPPSTILFVDEMHAARNDRAVLILGSGAR